MGNRKNRRRGKNSKKRLPFNICNLKSSVRYPTIVTDEFYGLLNNRYTLYNDWKKYYTTEAKELFGHLRNILGLDWSCFENSCDPKIIQELKKEFPNEIPDGCGVVCIKPQYFEEHTTYVSYDNTGGLYAFEIKIDYSFPWNFNPIVEKEVNPEPWEYYLANYVDDERKKNYKYIDTCPTNKKKLKK